VGARRWLGRGAHRNCCRRVAARAPCDLLQVPSPPPSVSTSSASAVNRWWRGGVSRILTVRGQQGIFGLPRHRPGVSGSGAWAGVRLGLERAGECGGVFVRRCGGQPVAECAGAARQLASAPCALVRARELHSKPQQGKRKGDVNEDVGGETSGVVVSCSYNELPLVSMHWCAPWLLSQARGADLGVLTHSLIRPGGYAYSDRRGARLLNRSRRIAVIRMQRCIGAGVDRLASTAGTPRRSLRGISAALSGDSAGHLRGTSGRV
jgi:hypothetical protein